jgi:hypothetical protein
MTEAMYGIDIEGELAKILPPECEEEINLEKD